ncbi:hypothetical protein [Puniceibacterium sp. IMCC21224]|uniref:hypothetical protein n=1 Tax=Puniceibacterium sp. IMCC21224 TaxID=1618204 RepID=UPI00065CEF81|nr:hypothetical protein [Puniceibacterium sp. IMCC21224]KMK65372.1 hypothetical protein IMCC21224_11203 [Puniceibacterium sp. IMCC21224]
MSRILLSVALLLTAPTLVHAGAVAIDMPTLTWPSPTFPDDTPNCGWPHASR